MRKEEIVTKAFAEISKKYQYAFHTSIDVSLSNLANEVRNTLFQGSTMDYEMVNIYYSLCNYLYNEISSYVFSRFSNENMNQMLKNIDENNKNQFDKWFFEDMEFKKNNNIWIHPVERRLMNFIEKEKSEATNAHTV